jgi:hypothetical protein
MHWEKLVINGTVNAGYKCNGVPVEVPLQLKTKRKVEKVKICC